MHGEGFIPRRCDVSPWQSGHVHDWSLAIRDRFDKLVPKNICCHDAAIPQLDGKDYRRVRH